MARQQSPKYWFSILLDSLCDGDDRGVKQAETELRNAGFEISVMQPVPVSEIIGHAALFDAVKKSTLKRLPVQVGAAE